MADFLTGLVSGVLVGGPIAALGIAVVAAGSRREPAVAVKADPDRANDHRELPVATRTSH